MGRVSFVFSGQGDQFPGMGRELYERSPAAARVFELCDALRPGTIHQCFEGSVEELKETKNTQPCLFAMELAAWAALNEKSITPDAVAGFSLGEVAAATAAGCFDFQTGFHLVCKRGALMQAESEKYDSAMAAVVKLTAEQVTALCADFPHIWPVNFNGPGNTTVSGLAGQMPAFTAAVKAAGGRALPLKVKGAFHSPLMEPAAEAFALELEGMKAPEIPLYSNVSGGLYGTDAASLLARQIASPVRWEAIIRTMIARGVDTFVEIGPGRTLTNMIKKIDPTVTAKTVTEVLEESQC